MRLLPRRLYGQLVFLVSVIVIVTLSAYSWFTGKKHYDYAVSSAMQQVGAMAKNLAISCSGEIIDSNYASLETLLIRSADFPDILEIQVCDAQGIILSNIVHARGMSPRARFDRSTLTIPSYNKAFMEIRDKRIIAWQPVISGNLIGWVRIVHDLKMVHEIRGIMWKDSLLAGALGIISSFLILLIALKRPVAAIRRVSAFAKILHDVKGAQIAVEHSSLEIQQLCESLNSTSLELCSSEEQLLAERERLAVTLLSIGDGVIATDNAAKIVLVNKVAEELTGWTHPEAVGRSLSEVFRIINEKTRKPAEDPISKVLRSGAIVGLANHTALISRNGEERSIADSAAPIKDGTGNTIGVVLVFRDVTEKNRLENDLLRARKLESIGTLAGGIAHDFNNILTAILGNISVVTDSMDSGDPAYKTLNTAENAALRAKDLAQQLLTFAKGGAPILRTAHIGDLLEETVNFSLSGSKVKADIEKPDDLRPAEIDGGQISQVIQNLVINARDAMPEGGVLTISAKNVSITRDSAVPLEPGDYIMLSVADQGVGIPKEHLDMIFDPYFTTKKGGSGLGLATTYSIVKRHKGHITVESTYESGTVFEIYLPASHAEETDAGRVSAKQASALIGSRNILVMDDEGIVRETIGAMLARSGHKVKFAADGKEAAEIYRQAMEAEQPYDAVIMDLTIPGGIGGKEAIKLLIDMDPNVKAIVSSGYSSDPVTSECRKYGFKAVLSKPFKTRELMAVLNGVIAGE